MENKDPFPVADETAPPEEKAKRFRVSAACIAMNKNVDMFPAFFREWLPLNLHIWNAFEQEAKAVWRKGFKHYSSRTIVHVLRHHSAMRETGGEWKINNNISPSLSRLFDLLNPEIKGLWEFRDSPAIINRKSLKKGARRG